MIDNEIDLARQTLVKKFKPEYRNYINEQLAGDFAVEIYKKLKPNKLLSYIDDKINILKKEIEEKQKLKFLMIEGVYFNKGYIKSINETINLLNDIKKEINKDKKQ